MPVNANGVSNGVLTEAADLIAGEPSEVVRVASLSRPDVSRGTSGTFEVVAILV